MANLSGIVKQLKKERIGYKQLSGLNAALEAFAGVYRGTMESGLEGGCQLKAGQVSLPLKEHAGQKLRNNRQVRSRSCERC